MPINKMSLISSVMIGRLSRSRIAFCILSLPPTSTGISSGHSKSVLRMFLLFWERSQNILWRSRCAVWDVKSTRNDLNVWQKLQNVRPITGRYASIMDDLSRLSLKMPSVWVPLILGNLWRLLTRLNVFRDSRRERGKGIYESIWG